MPIIGYKKKFKQIPGLREDIFTINFKLEYTLEGSLKIQDEENNYFDVGDFNLLLDEVFEGFDEDKCKEYDNGVYILSVCKYIVDKVPNLYSINYETLGMIDTYYKDEIIHNYNKIRNCKRD